MLIDHVGAAFFPSESYLRVIGRIAFPLYAYLLVAGYSRTRSFSKYATRLTALACLSQIPFSLLFHTYKLNAVATLLVALLTLRLLDYFISNHVMQLLVAFAAISLLELVSFDYGMYGLLLVLIYRYAKPSQMVWLHIALNIIVGLLLYHWVIQLYSFFTTALIVYFPLLIRQIEKIHIPRWLWLSFYPAHMLVLVALRLLEKY